MKTPKPKLDLTKNVRDYFWYQAKAPGEKSQWVPIPHKCNYCDEAAIYGVKLDTKMLWCCGDHYLSEGIKHDIRLKELTCSS